MSGWRRPLGAKRPSEAKAVKRGLKRLSSLGRQRTRETTKHIPVVILTGYDALEIGPVSCEGILTKLCFPDQMIAKIAAILEQRNQASSNENPPGSLETLWGG